MWAPMIVKRQIVIQPCFSLPNLVPITQIDFVVLHRAPQAFDKNIIKGSPSSIHADRNASRFQAPCKHLAGKLAPLITIEDIRFARLERSLQRGETERRVQTDRHLPTQHIPTEPVHDRHQIDKTTGQPNVCDVRTPDLIGADDPQLT